MSKLSPPSLHLSQRSLQSEPIFRLLLKVAVNGTHQCDSLNFCGKSASQPCSLHVWLEVGGRHGASEMQSEKDTRGQHLMATS